MPLLKSMKPEMEERTCIFGASVMLKRLDDLRNEISGVEMAGDIEFIHRMRVASRRLRSTFVHFQKCYPEKKVTTWQKHIRQVTKSLGMARDLDVQIEAVKNAQTNLEQIQFRPGIHRLQLRLQQRREKIQPQVVEAMANLRNSGVLEEMDKKLTEQAIKEDGSQPYTLQLYQLSYQAITQQLDSLHAHEELIFDPDQIEALHAMRIDAKHLRYTLEIFSPLYAGRAEEFIKLVKTIQEFLGNIHDCDVWITTLPEFVAREKERTRKYYGHEGPFNLLTPGINHFLDNQKSLRAGLYNQFIHLWHTWKAQEVWENLNRTIEQPLSFHSDAYSLPAPVTEHDNIQENSQNNGSCEQL